MSIRDFKLVPESYILPPDSRPGDTKIPFCNTIPVLDLKDPTSLVQQIIEASTEFGFFQVSDFLISLFFSFFN